VESTASRRQDSRQQSANASKPAHPSFNRAAQALATSHRSPQLELRQQQPRTRKVAATTSEQTQCLQLRAREVRSRSPPQPGGGRWRPPDVWCAASWEAAAEGAAGEADSAVQRVSRESRLPHVDSSSSCSEASLRRSNDPESAGYLPSANARCVAASNILAGEMPLLAGVPCRPFDTC
jgi:hypothetical protein